MANLSWISSNPDYINQMIRNTQVTLSNNYNDLDNIPIIKITSTTNNPQKIWELKEGLYMIDGVVQVDNNTSYEVSNLLISMTARLENGKYILSAFIPYLRGLFEYILKTNSAEYEQHQKIVLMIKNDTLALDNETIYTPIEDYHPATKKYVDDKANEVVAELDKMGVNKENLESLNKENRIRDIKLQALLSETSDRNITIEENVRYFDMPLSIDNGIVTINEIIGETLVNVCDQEESVAITKSYTVENENHIPLQGEYDGSCRPIVHGNTLVNHNADWDDSLQTGIETSASGIEDVQVEGIKGQEVSVVVEGNTVLNHALGKTSAVVSAIESENDGNYVDLTVANDMSSVVEIEGRTMVNVCDQKEPIAITKSYTVENSGNHIALQGEYDGSCRPVIQGNTLVNLAPISYNRVNANLSDEVTLNSLNSDPVTLTGRIKEFTPIVDLRYGTLYTITFDVISITEGIMVHGYIAYDEGETQYSIINADSVGKYSVKFTLSQDAVVTGFGLYINIDTIENIAVIKNVMLFEGDLTQTPELIPTEYVEGLKSSFEDGYIPENLANKATHTIVGSESNSWYKHISLTKSLEVGKTYTLICNVESYTLNAGFRIIGRVGTGNTNLQYGLMDTMTKAGVHCNSFIAKEPLNTLSIADEFNSTTGEATITDFILIEGDYKNNPPTYEEVTNHVGKYKVEYKVTGKNLINEKTLTTGAYSADGTSENNWSNYAKTDFIQVKANTSYIMCNLTYNDVLINTTDMRVGYYDVNKKFIKSSFVTDGLFTATENTHFVKVSQFVQTDSVDVELIKNWQLEEGTQATPYEPYKEYTKTFYLNSPLLEGDTIEDISGVATHVKRYGKVVLDGNEDWNIYRNLDGNKTIDFRSRLIEGMLPPNVEKAWDYNICLSNIFLTDKHYPMYTGEDKEFLCISTNINEGVLISINKDKLQSQDIQGIKQWLSENPTTVVYELATPIYEPISTESILCDSYVNGHLDFDSAVPIEKVEFKGWETNLNYLYTNTAYNLQFESDNIGELSFNLGNTLLNQKITKGVNKFNITIPESIANSNMFFTGIGFNASNIVVTEAIDADFDYFEGLSSTYESCYPGGKNLFDGTFIENEFVDNIGNFIKDNGMLRTDYIKIKPNIAYTISNSNKNIKYTYYRFFDSNKVFISYGQNNTHTIYCTTPKNAKYLIVCYLKTDILSDTTIQIEEGTTATSYEPFIDKYKVDVKVTGKNLFDGELVVGYLGSSSGSLIEVNNHFSGKNFIPVNKGMYTITYWSTQTVDYPRICTYDKNFKFIASLSIATYKKTASKTIEIDDEIAYVKVSLYKVNEVTEGEVQIQLEEGTVATSYEPYFESTKTFYLNSPLLEGDKIVTKNGKVYHYHKMGKVVLDGSEDEGWIRKQPLTTSSSFATKSNFISKPQYSTIPVACNTLPLSNFSSVYSNDVPGVCTNSDACAIYIRNTQLKLDDFILWLSENPTTVVYELASPYYELVDEYNNTILNIPKNVAHLTHTSAVPVNNTTFTNYKDELNVLESNTQYRVMFDCDKANIPFTVTLGGTSQAVTSKKGTHSLLITTPSELVDKNLVIDGIGRCGIDNIRIFKGDVEYDYVKGLWSGYEERKLGKNLYDYISHGSQNSSVSYSDNIFTITIGAGNYPSIRLQLLNPLNIKKQYTIIFEAKSTVPNKRIKWGACKANLSAAWNVTQLLGMSNVKYLTTSYKQYCSIVSFRLGEVNDNIGFGFFTQNDNQWLYEKIYIKNILILEGDWTDNPPTYEEVMANEGKYAVKVKLDTNATIFGKGGRL